MYWRDIKTWPLADLSRQVHCPPHRWHVQETGTGPTLLLIHGAGGSTHSYRDMIPLLAKDWHVIAIDLPGHGFTRLGARHRSGLEAMAQDLHSLCDKLGAQPAAIVGHSAGAAVALRLAQLMAEDPGVTMPRVIGINAALGEFEGLAGVVFPIMAKALAAMPFASHLFSGTSNKPKRVEALIGSTGSALAPDGIALYRRLVGDRDHVDGTLIMMAQWDLRPLLKSLKDHTGCVQLIVGEQDKTVPPTVSLEAARSLPNATVYNVPGGGHLAHEEAPAYVVRIINLALK